MAAPETVQPPGRLKRIVSRVSDSIRQHSPESVRQEFFPIKVSSFEEFMEITAGKTVDLIRVAPDIRGVGFQVSTTAAGRLGNSDLYTAVDAWTSDGNRIEYEQVNERAYTTQWGDVNNHKLRNRLTAYRMVQILREKFPDVEVELWKLNRPATEEDVQKLLAQAKELGLEPHDIITSERPVS